MAAHGCRRVAAASFALAVLHCAGCALELFDGKGKGKPGPGGTARHATAATANDAQMTHPALPQGTVSAVPHGKRGKTAPLGSASALPNEQVAEVIEGLQALERLDPQARATVQASLDRTHPTNWPYVFRFHRAALSGKAPAPALAGGPAPPAPPWGFPASEAARPPGRFSASHRPGGDLEPRHRGANRLLASSQIAKDSAAAATWPPDSESQATAFAPMDDSPSSVPSRPRWWSAGFQAERSERASRETEDAEPRGQWERHLHRAIESLEAQTQEHDDKSGHALLRVLYAVAGRREDALRPIPAASEAEREFWVNEMRGLSECLDQTSAGSPDRRAAEAARWLRDAAGRLAELGTLEVQNLAFCTAVHSFGSLDRFAKYEFQPGEAVLLYAEIENFASEETKTGYRTALKGRYDLLEGPRRVHEEALPAAEETCERLRRDFFVSYRLHLPSHLKAGQYTLQLTIDDTLGRKTATRSIGLRIK
jgi:hypothetical protein